ncbi:hypothetical protein OIU85_023980 [Salix viminalis]|uniref:chorismate mutase n=1 Tax=Salix viminalis TaxID=40686 RepID=A0A9Q0Z476_SALVM|nr:hypothetical protein OIU85_023980 [Salix viminalis]
MYKAEPNLAVNLYEDWIMPLTKEVQAEHLLRMLDSCQVMHVLKDFICRQLCIASLIGQILPEEKVVILSTYELGKSWGINRRRFSQFSRQLLVSAFYHTLDGKSSDSSFGSIP